MLNEAFKYTENEALALVEALEELHPQSPQVSNHQDLINHLTRYFDEANADRRVTGNRRFAYTAGLAAPLLIRAFSSSATNTVFETTLTTIGVLGFALLGFAANVQFDRKIARLGQLKREADKKLLEVITSDKEFFDEEDFITRDELMELAKENIQETIKNDTTIESYSVYGALVLVFSFAVAQIYDKNGDVNFLNQEEAITIPALEN